MAVINLFERSKKLNKNKKGFTLVELLVAVAMIAIVTPFLVKGFIYATELNYRSRLQQRADAAANSVYEGIASVKYEDLTDYLSDINGWKPVDDGTGTEYDYYVYKYYDDLEDCEVKVAVQKYSSSYVVPDLNFLGVDSQYLTLAREINDFDGVAANKIEQAAKSSDAVKNVVVNDIVSQIRNTYGEDITASQIDRSKILINCGSIDKDKISKETSIDLNIVGDDFLADYSVSYRYPAEAPNPDVDDGTLKVSYKYAHNLDGSWVSISNSELDVGSQINVTVVSDSVSIAAEKTGDTYASQSLFVFYDPVSKMDWVNIQDIDSSDYNYNVFFIEQTPDDEKVLSFDIISPTSMSNNFMYKWAARATNEYVLLTQAQGGSVVPNVSLYSNLKTISENGIPDAIYESSEKEESMYRVQVLVTYQSTIFAEVSGTFEAGGGNVDKYVG